MKVYNIKLVLSEIRQIVVESKWVKRVNLPEVSSDILDIQFISATATVSVVHTDLGDPDLQELGQVDQEGGQAGREEIGEEPAGSGLALPEVVRPADRQESLNTNCQQQEDTQAEHDPGHQLEKGYSEQTM